MLKKCFYNIDYQKRLYWIKTLDLQQYFRKYFQLNKEFNSDINSVLLIDKQINKKVELDTGAVFKILC